MSDNHSRRVVVTGLGAMTGLGHSVDETWKNLLAGKSGVRRITLSILARMLCRSRLR